MKLAQKGLFVVLLPVAFELAFVLRVNDLLQQTDQQIAKEVHAVQFLLANQNLNADIVHANRAALCFQAYKSPEYKQDHDRATAKIMGDIVQMNGLSTSKAESQMIRGFMYRQQAALRLRQMMMSDLDQAAHMSSLFGGEQFSKMLARGFYNGDLTNDPIEEENKKREAEALAQSDAIHRTLHDLLLVGMAVSLMVSGITAVLFHRQIYSRLHRIIVNIDNMLKHSMLIPPAKATDEIGELDVAIYQTANSIRELENFRAKGAKLMAVQLEHPLDTVSRSIQELKQDGFDSITKEGKDAVDSAASLAARLQLLIGDLVSIDKISEARLQLHYSKTDAAAIVAQAVEAARAVAESADVEVVNEAKSLELECDSGRIMQIVINLLSNAIKASSPNSTVTIETFTEGDSACITVLDRGKGIDPLFQSKIFKRFEQSQESDQQRGTGLGLSICRELGEAHGGILDFESEPGRTKFKLKIPVQRADRRSTTATTDSAPTPVSRKQNLWHKGMALVLTLAMVQLAAVCVLFFLAEGADKQMRVFRHARQIAFACSDTTDDLLRAIYGSLLYNATGEPSLGEQLKQRGERLRKDVEDLRNISKDHPEDAKRAEEISTWTLQTLDSINRVAQSPHHNMLLNEWVKDDPSFGPLSEQAKGIGQRLEEWTKEGQSQIKKQIAMSAEARRTIMYVLIGGLTCSVLASLTLALAFARGVCARIYKIITNARRLVKHEELTVPADKNRDEIDTIDREFYNAAQHLLELDRFKEQLMSVTSHELRTPLTGLLVTFEVISTGMYGELSARGHEALSNAINAASDLVSLITNFLDLEKMRAGKTLVGPVSMPATWLLDILSERIENLKTSGSVADDITVNADADRVVQAVQAIIKTSARSNAIEIKADNDGVKLSLEAEHTLVVADESEEKDDSFSPQQLSLALCEMIAVQHGGKFGREGDRLIITLPR